MTLNLKQLQADIDTGTKGPWEADPDIVGWNNGRNPACAVMFQTSGDRNTGLGGWSPVAWAMPSSKTEFETLANASRIARVPELEAALIEAVGCLQEAQGLYALLVDPAQFEGVSSGDAYLKIRSAEARVRTLLAKLGEGE